MSIYPEWFKTNIETDAIKEQVVRGGKKVWITKHTPSEKKRFMTPARRMALIKARLKAKSSASKAKRKKSDKARKLYGMN